jgi:hypothetical protein
MLRLPAVAAVLYLWSSLALAQDGGVEVAVLTDDNWDEYVPLGKEVDAIVGDIVIRNQYLTAVIAQPIASRHANMTVRDVGGCLIDLTTRENQSDQLGCFYPGRREFAYRSWSVEVDDQPVEVTDTLVARGERLVVTVHSDAIERHPAIDVHYSIDGLVSWVQIVTACSNMADQELALPGVDEIRFDVGKEWAYRTPNGTADRYQFADHYWEQAYEVFSPQGPMQFNSDSRTTTLTFLDQAGGYRAVIPAGTTSVLERRLACSRNVLVTRNALWAIERPADTAVELRIDTGAGIGIDDLSGAFLTIYQEDDLLGTLRCDDSGFIRARMASGWYSGEVRYHGVVVSRDQPFFIPPPMPFLQYETIECLDFFPGDLDVHVTDGDGSSVACKIELIPQGNVPVPDFGPETAEFAVKNLLYAPHGTASRSLHPGLYDIIISHGPEYDAVFTTVEIKPGETTKLAATLPRVVDTTGWVSSDFHSHSSPSGDNTSSQLGRVVNLLCEHIEFAPCTEHNRISTYQPHIDRLGIADRLASCSGMELTGSQLPLNHHNVFPLHHHHHRQDGGGPLTDADPQVQIERVALWDSKSEKLVQQNHPDIGWLFFDKDGDGTPDDGYSGAFGFMDVIEIHPIDAAWNLPLAAQPAKDQSNRVFHWLQLLNQGYRIPGVVNTDAHYNFHGSGGLRNWLESPTDNPGEVQVLDMVHAAEHGHVVMSNGPFLTVHALTVPTFPEALEAGDSVFDTAGGDLIDTDGKSKLIITVQSPNWIDVDEVFVLVNGHYDAGLHFRRGDNSGYFREGVLKFDATLEMTLESDAHLIVVAGAPEKTLGKVAGGYWATQKPTAISNPIYIDVNGDGFTPNKDTLGAPLPVKDGTPAADSAERTP